MHVCTLWNKALGTVWGGCLKKPLEWCVCVLGGGAWEVHTSHGCCQLALSLSVCCHCIGHRSWVWSGPLFKLEVANWWKAGLIQPAEAFYLASTMTWKDKNGYIVLSPLCHSPHPSLLPPAPPPTSLPKFPAWPLCSFELVTYRSAF